MLLPLEAVQQSSSFSVVQSWVELAIGTGTLAVAGSLPALHLALQTFSSGSQHRRLVAEPIGASRSCACCTRRVAHWPCVPGTGHRQRRDWALTCHRPQEVYSISVPIFCCWKPPKKTREEVLRASLACEIILGPRL